MSNVSMIDRHIDREERKFTDKEIIKALECCSSPNANCEDCPCFNKDCISTTPYVLDLIKSQQAEIEALTEDTLCLRDTLEENERLRAEIERLSNSAKQWEETAKDLLLSKEKAKAEAIKEFAKMLKERLKGSGGLFCVTTMNAQIDNLVKEMVGEDK